MFYQKIINSKKSITLVVFSLVLQSMLYSINIRNAVSAESNQAASQIDELDEFDIVKDDNDTLYDPLENINRKTLSFNVALYDNIIIPLYNAYDKYVPLYIKWSLKNISDNYIEVPQTFIISFLDNDPDGALIAFWRFMINSTFGIFGIFDIAGKFNLDFQKKNFNLLMSLYGVPNGPYLMIPLLGPKTTRDGIGMIFDWFLDPTTSKLLFGLPISMIHAYAAIINPMYFAIPAFSTIEASGLLRTTLFKFSTLAQTAVIKHLHTTSLDVYDGYKKTYIQYAKQTEKRYYDSRKEIKLSSQNICDNTFSVMFDTLEECNTTEPKSKDYASLNVKN